ncbi:hypothetical protein HK101_011255 [Irineochytrium annulatum]|nr:hypothetical protein HK101_011255 [Irineochytrium annulatum]
MDEFSASSSSSSASSVLENDPTTPVMRRNGARKRHRPRSLLRRGSSFGGAPIVVQNVAPLPEVVKVQASSNVRWVILVLSCLLLFGNYYGGCYGFYVRVCEELVMLMLQVAAYDNPAALNRPLQEYLGHDYDTWQTLFALGVHYKHFGVMIVGRIIFGIGGESISVVQSSITTSWFKKKELAFALGLNLCISRFGSVVNAICSPRIARLFNPSIAVWAGTLACYLSLLCSVILAVVITTHSAPLDENLHQHIRRPAAEDLPRTPSTRFFSFDGSVDDAEVPSTESTSLLVKRKSGVAEETVEKFGTFVSEVKKFPTAFWLVCLICVLLYGTVIPFNTIASDFLMSKWYPGDTETAGIVMSIPDSMSAILVPICGAFVDHYGHRATLLIFCSISIACVHLTLGLTYFSPIPPLILLGLSYSIYGVAIWPSIATIIQHREQELWDEMPENSPMPKLLGTAYGLSTACLNTALTIMPLVAAEIRVRSGDFLWVECFFVALAVVGVLAGRALQVVDSRHGGILEKPEVVADADDGSGSEEDGCGREDVGGAAEDSGADGGIGNGGQRWTPSILTGRLSRNGSRGEILYGSPMPRTPTDEASSGAQGPPHGGLKAKKARGARVILAEPLVAGDSSNSSSATTSQELEDSGVQEEDSEALEGETELPQVIEHQLVQKKTLMVGVGRGPPGPLPSFDSDATLPDADEGADDPVEAIMRDRDRLLSGKGVGPQPEPLITVVFAVSVSPSAVIAGVFRLWASGCFPWKLTRFSSPLQFYVVTSIVMVIFNKAVLNAVSLPLTFLWLQLLVAVLLLLCCHNLRLLRLPRLEQATSLSLSPLILINVLGLTLNTLCLQHVDASFFQVARSMVLPFTCAMSRLWLRESHSWLTLSACGVVFAGFATGTALDAHKGVGSVTMLGVTLGVMSSLSTAAHAIVIKSSLDRVRGDTMELVWYNNVLSCLVLAPFVILSGEIGEVQRMWGVRNGHGGDVVRGRAVELVTDSDSDGFIGAGGDGNESGRDACLHLWSEGL